jgi:3-isopropylmalate/(R)-2-methylmalate dehydratase large subunit
MFDVGQHGISHVVAAERGLTRPGELLVCADSHTCASGGLNCAGRGTGIPDALQAITRGVVWYLVTPTVRYEFKGELGPMVSGKDVFFHIAQTWGKINGGQCKIFSMRMSHCGPIYCGLAMRR